MTPSEPATSPDQHGRRSVLNSSAVMAAGTLVSRFSGYFRGILLAAALGNAIHADVFTIANTIPNMLYILLAGGVVNAVLVPQLVRAAKADVDGGDAYTSRVITLVGGFLLLVTVLLVVFAPQVMGIFLDPNWPAQARDSAVDLARFCLPQVFFYGMFVLVGQVLNARGRFGPMMWAPIANNVISIGVLVLYLVVFGPADSGAVGYTTDQELLLGIGSTLGIVAQFLVLVPYLRAAGVIYRPRFDFRDAGLGHTLRLGVWTLLFVIANQVAYAVIVRLSSSGTAAGSPDGTGYTIYSQAFLIIMVPHAVVTVSLATAILPRLSAQAADGNRPAMAATLAPTLRTALAVIVPFAALLPVFAHPLARLLWGYGAAQDTYDNYVPTLSLFGPALVLFTIHYLMLRGFYALEQNRTVFFIQVAVAVTNIVAATALVRATDDKMTAPALVIGYTLAYAVGALLSSAVLRARLGGLQIPATLGFLGRLLVAVAVSTAAAYLVARLLAPWADDHTGVAGAFTQVLTIGVVDVVVFLAMAALLRLREVTEVLALVTSRVRR
ncbi:murein biosynthesis integral membrane protein MurJ [Nocardioides insulae]|uniref:murein biosynthesis integral membrane protein MurJ n=1 Tax=Nocardioides insulae TaxID=394734 RepID=UPI000412574C|nr:murein biosynthesis integral membrane protein MurJ [Nocardioides insulae]